MRALQVKEMWPACVISEGALAKALKGLGTNSNGDWARGTPGQYFPPSSAGHTSFKRTAQGIS